MNGVIPICMFRRKKEKEEKAWDELERKIGVCQQDAEEDVGTVESAIRMMASLGEVVRFMLNTSFGRQIAEAERKEDEDFKRRYQEIFDGAPDMPAARIKYFCGVLLELWRAVEAGGLKCESIEYDDFCRIYMDGVDRSVSDWCRRDRKTKETDDEVQTGYPFFELEVTKQNMGCLLSETLEKIISARPEGGAAKKDFLRELLRLFEIYRGILYVFSDETETGT